MKFEQAIVGIGLLCVMGLPMTVEASDSKSITLKQIGRYSAGASTVPDEPRAEIAAYDPASKRLFSINLNLRQLDVLDLSNPESQVLAPVQTVPLGGKPNSVAIRDGIIAVAVEGTQKTDPGTVKFFNTSGALLNTLTVGSLPDMLVFSPNGKWLLVANEGEPNSYNNNPVPSVDPEGSVSVIDMTPDVTSLTQLNVRTATFSLAIPQQNASSIRIYGPNATLAQDIEPEYITVSHDSKTAWVTLQENNAIGILDISTAKFTKIVGLGFKDHNLPGNGFDASDRDTAVDNGLLKDGINIKNWPVFGMYEPDAIASYRVKGETYLVTANEGDTRDYPPGFTEEVRAGAGSYELDPAVFLSPFDPPTLKNNANLGRLTVTNATGAKELDADPQFERIYVPGGRSFSIRRANGTLVYDSGDDIEQRTAALLPDLFNSQGDSATFDTRSDNKGPEPEGVAIGKVSGRTYAFIGLERIGGVMVYDISKPTSPKFATYINTAPTDLAPEGLFFIKKKDSPNSKPLLVVSHEVSNTVTIFEVVGDPEEEEAGEEDDEDEVGANR
jgi:2',3'-cyclic-nucleotide 2'-phosphodiesterase / 3'-nucleotidase / 5'-nucleotidase